MPTGAPEADVVLPFAAVGRWRGRVTFAAYRTAGAVLPHIPATVSVPVAQAVGRALARPRSTPREMAAQHTGRVLGRRLGAREAARAAQHVFSYAARYWVEVFSLPGLPGDVIDEHMAVTSGWEDLRAALEGDGGVILALPHLGSWEWGGAWLARRGHPMTAVAEVLEPPELFDWFVRQRAALGLHVVPLSASAGGTLSRMLRSGGLVGLVADRDLLGTGVPVEFFGETTTLPAGPATLALRTGAALFPTAVYQGPGRGHHAVILPAVDTARHGDLRSDVHRITQDMARGFEELIGRAPEQWFCFQPNWPSERPAAGDGAPRQAGPGGSRAGGGGAGGGGAGGSGGSGARPPSAQGRARRS